MERLVNNTDINTKSFSHCIRLDVLLPFSILALSYLLTVATDSLDDYKIYFRLFVAIYFTLYILIYSNKKISTNYFLIELLLVFYFALIIFINYSPIALNFIFLIVALHFFKVARVENQEFVVNALLAYLIVLVVHIIIVIVTNTDLSPKMLDGRPRYYFGLSNPNKAGFLFFSIMVFLVFNYIYFKFSYLLLLVGTSSLFTMIVITGSRAAIFTSMLFFVFLVFKFRLFGKYLVSALSVIFLVISYAASYFHDDFFLHSILSGRLRDYHEFLITLDWQSFFLGGSSEGFRVDNSYLQAYFNVGFLPYLIFVFMTFISTLRLRRPEVAFLVVMLSYGLFEGILVRPELLLALFFYHLVSAYPYKKNVFRKIPQAIRRQ